MPASKKNPWLLCYDIGDPKRLQRVHRTVLRYAIPLQYSVFFAYGTKREILSVIDAIDGLIDERKDDVRAYPLSLSAQVHTFGCSLLPEGVKFFQDQISLYDLVRERNSEKQPNTPTCS